MSKAVIVIPARYGSSRLPGKPLLDIVGKPMIQHVYERALQVAGVAEVWVATDDQRVEKAVQAFGGKAIMTRNDHESGTDRLVEVMHKVEADIYINLQGDEPMIRPRDVDTLLQGMRDDPALPVATLCHDFCRRSDRAKHGKSGGKYPPGCALFQPFAYSVSAKC